jgi:hypothetical protein
MRFIAIFCAATVLATLLGCITPVPRDSESPVPTSGETTPSTSSPSPSPPKTPAPVPDPCSLSPEGPAPDSLPSVIAQTDRGITKWVWNGSASRFDNASFASVPGRWRSSAPMEVHQDHVYLLNETHLLQYGADLALLRSVPIPSPVTLGTGSGMVLVATNGTVESYDATLVRRDVLELNASAWSSYRKNADFILFHDDVAYVVDDIVTPYYMLRLDVSSISDLRELTRTDLSGINAGHGPQWINTTARVWGIRASWSALGPNGVNSGTDLHLLGLDNGTSFRSMPIEPRALDSVDPRVAAFLHEQGVFASTAALTESGFQYGCSFDLQIPPNEAGNVLVWEHDEHAIVVSGRELRVLSLSSGLELVHKQSLDGPGHVSNIAIWPSI